MFCFLRSLLAHRRTVVNPLVCCCWLLAMACSGLWAQSRSGVRQPQPQQRKVYLEHANTLSFDKNVSADYQVLRGNVRFRQDSAFMYCDSAYYYEKSNSLDAFGRVRMEQGDSLYLFADSLYYDGNTGRARLVDNVRLIHNNVILYSDRLYYARFSNEAYYDEWGVIVDPENLLKSNKGWYYTNQKTAVFRYDVQLRHYVYGPGDRPANPDGLIEVDYLDAQDIDNLKCEEAASEAASDSVPGPGVQTDRYGKPLVLMDDLLEAREPAHASLDPDDEAMPPRTKLFSDTLHYNMTTGLAEIVGPSRIISDADTATIFTDLGYYNTKLDVAHLYNHSYMISPNRYLTGDTIYYNRAAGYGNVYGHLVACDTLQSMTMTGDKAYFNDVDRSGWVTGRALAMEYSQGDTLYLHADTLRTYMTPDSVRYMNAYYGVRIYRTDLQGVCDSLSYNVTDSLARFIGKPVLWNEQYQITGDTIIARLGENGLDKAFIHDNAFLVQQKDSIHYDQILGKELEASFDSLGIKQMDMSGNVQVVFYPEEKDHSLIGLNQVIGNYLTIWFVQKKMDHLRIWPDPVGSLTPIELITDDILYLKNFRWLDYLRPKSPKDVFRREEMKKEDIIENPTIFNQDELNGY